MKILRLSLPTVLLVGLLGAATARAGGPYDLTVEPAEPTSADTIRIVLEGSWTCPSLSQPQVADRLVVLSFSECGSLAPPTHHVFERFVPPLEPGPHTLLLLADDDGTVLHRQELEVTDAGGAPASRVVPLDPPIRLAVPGQERGHGPPDVALRPDGGLVAVWSDFLPPLQILGARLGPPSDQPAEPEIFELGLEDDVGSPVLAAGAHGTYLAAWLSSSGTVPPGLVVRTFDGEGENLSPRRVVAPEPVTAYSAAALPSGGFVVVWWQDPRDRPTLRFRLLGPTGAPLEPARVIAELAEGDASLWRLVTRVAARSDGTFVVTWSEAFSDTPPGIRARTFAADGTAIGEAFDLVTLDAAPDPIEHDLAVTTAEDFLLLYLDRPTEPARFAPGGIFALRFDADSGTAAGSVQRVDSGDEGTRRSDPALAMGTDGKGVAAWAVEEGTGGFRVLARLIHRDGSPRSAPFEVASPEDPEGFPLDLPHTIDAERDDRGRMAFGWAAGRDQGGILPSFAERFRRAELRRFRELAGPAAAPPPPDRQPVTSDALPGFRVWVDITDQEGVTVAGAREEPCIPETLCVSGRLPGRSEAFVRVIGPRPNGRLWPVLVRFTTSRVEVWIEQVETGEVEYYALRGARPGIDELPGLFDREGFEP